jgi:LEA14-like dessication related protein
MLRLLLLIAIVLGATACHSALSPELTVLGVREAARHEVVFLQVTNPASRPMRLTKLEYTFASQGERVSSGEVSLSRDVPAGAAVVVEVPLDVAHDGPVTLQGKLIAELDQIVRTFTVSAQVDPR